MRPSRPGGMQRLLPSEGLAWSHDCWVAPSLIDSFCQNCRTWAEIGHELSTTDDQWMIGKPGSRLQITLPRLAGALGYRKAGVWETGGP